MDNIKDNQDNYENILNRLNNISKFEYNWNGYDAKGFNNETGLRVIEIARELWKVLYKCECEIREIGLRDFKFNVFPTGRCSVQFEVRVEEKNGENINFDEFEKYFEVEVFRKRIVVFKAKFIGIWYEVGRFEYELNENNEIDLKEIGKKICGECREFFVE